MQMKDRKLLEGYSLDDILVFLKVGQKIEHNYI
jgi:hypothetical protein